MARRTSVPDPRGNKPGKAKEFELDSEKIAAQLEAFRASGGTIEVLGTTRVLQRIGAVAPATDVPTRRK